MKGSKQADGTIEGSRTHKTGMFLEHNQICLTKCNERLNSLTPSHFIITKSNLKEKAGLKRQSKACQYNRSTRTGIIAVFEYDGYHVIYQPHDCLLNYMYKRTNTKTLNSIIFQS